MATSVQRREALLQRPAFRDLLAFEFDAHRRLLACSDRKARGVLYGSLYQRWGPLALRAFAEPGAEPAHEGRLGFDDVYLSWCAPWLRGARVLELGCGAGDGSAAISQIASEVTGLDVDEVGIDAARLRVPHVRFVAASITDPLPMNDASFDTVYWNDVAEHLHPDDLEFAVGEIRRVLKPRGHLLTITCHADDGPHDASMATERPGAPPRGMHLQEFTYRSIESILRRNGFNARHALLGVAALRKARLLWLIPGLLVERGPVVWFERSFLSRRSALLRRMTGADVVFSVAQKTL